MLKARRRRRPAVANFFAAVLAVILPVQLAAGSIALQAGDEWTPPTDYIDLVEQGWLENVSMVDYRWKYSTLLGNGKIIGQCGCQNTTLATALNWFYPLPGDTIPHAETPVHSWWDQKGPATDQELVWSPAYIDTYLTVKGGYKGVDGNGAGGCGTNAEPWALTDIGLAREIIMNGERISPGTGLLFTVHDTPGDGGLDNGLRKLIIGELEAERPVVVMRAAPGRDSKGQPKLAGHGNVIVGYNPDSKRFLAVDPAWKRGAAAQEGAPRPEENETYQDWEDSITYVFTFEKSYHRATYSTLSPGSGNLRTATAPAEYHLAVTRPDGQRAGWDPAGRRYVVSGHDFAYRAMRGVSLVGDEEFGRDPEKLYVSEPGSGTYRYEVYGVTDGGYALTLADEGGTSAAPRGTLSGDLTAGEVVKVEAVRGADGTTTTTQVPQFTPEARFDSATRISTAKDLAVDGTDSFDADGRITDWAWDFGDGTTGSGRQATHRYRAPGNYDVRLTVTDDAGASRSITRKVTVTRTEEFPPTVEIETPGGPFHREAFDIKISASDSGSGVRSMTYQASGATTVPATTVDSGDPVSLRISAEGRTTVTVRALDNDGNESPSYTMVVGVDTEPATSRVTTPLADGSTAGLGIVAGAVSDKTAGAASVEVQLTRDADGKTWDGSAWVDGDRWLAASTGNNPEDRWFIASKLPAGADLPKDGYQVRSRSVDAAGNAETPGEGISFTVTGSVLPTATPTKLSRNAGESVQLDAVDEDGTVVGLGSGWPVRWAPDGTRESLKTLSGGVGGRARDILNGVIVGYTGSPARATIWRDGVPADLGTLPGGVGADAFGVDAKGNAVGYAVDSQGRRRPVRFTAAGVAPLSAPPGTDVAVGEAGAVSPNGRYVVGLVLDAEGKQRLARWDGDAIALLPELDGSVPQRVNDSGDVVGSATIQSFIHAVLWDAAGAHDLGPGSANGIDNRGIVVGSYGIPGSTGSSAAVWQDGSLMRLDDQLSQGSGWELSNGSAISRTTGVVVGSGFKDGVFTPYRMAVPVLNGSVDRTPPQVSATPTDDEWHNDDVDVTVHATDKDSGVASVRTSVTGDVEGDTATARITAEGVTELAYTATDKAGNLAEPGTVQVRIDRTAPTLIAVSRSAEVVAGGWSREAVTIDLHGEDALSGIKALHATVDDGPEQVITATDGSIEVRGDGVHAVTAWAVDEAGNVSARRTLKVRIDATAPTVTFGGATDGATVDRGTTVAVAVSDATSGLASRTLVHTAGHETAREDGSTVVLRTDGQHTLNVVATDAAGNTTTATLSATVAGPSGPAAQLGDGPVAIAGGPYTVAAGMPLQLDGSRSSSPSGATLSYAWELPDSKDPVDAAQPTVTLDEPGLYLVPLVVSDGTRTSIPDFAVITVVERQIAEQGGTVNAGRAIPIVFTVKGDFGLDVFTTAPVSAPSTADGKATGPAVPAETPGESALTLDGTGRYQWVWKTDKSWAGTTRVIVLKLRDGREHRVVFQFR